MRMNRLIAVALTILLLAAAPSAFAARASRTASPPAR